MDRDDDVTAHSSESDPELVKVTKTTTTGPSSMSTADGADKQSTTPHPPTLVYAKSKVYIHPTSYSRDNLPGWITLLKKGRREYSLAWIPESLVRNDEREAFIKVEIGLDGMPGAGQPVTVTDSMTASLLQSTSLPPSPALAGSPAWSVPLSAVYSIHVTPPTLASWYGNIQIHLEETYAQSHPSLKLPLHRLYFHDDESPSTMLLMDRRSAALNAGKSSSSTRLPSSWGGEDLISALKRYSNVVRSSLQTTLYLINPSQSDLEAHSVPLFEDELPNAAAILQYRQHSSSSAASSDTTSNPRSSILHQSLSPHASTSNTEALPSLDNLTFNVLNSFSRITNRARHTAHNIAQPILAHPLSKPILKHLPPPIASLANANAPEYSSWAEKAGVAGYDAARVYLARWARVVAEEGERARRSEMKFSTSAPVGGSGVGTESDADELGGPFEVLATTYRVQRPRSTRVQGYQPIVSSEWKAWFDHANEGRLMLSAAEAKRRIFQRGLAEDARKEAWPFLLGVYEWESTEAERNERYKRRKQDYTDLRSSWYGKKEVTSTEQFVEEHHRIKIDCLRTDRNQPMFSSNAGTPTGMEGVSSKELADIRTASLAASTINTALRGDAGGQAASNYNIEKMIEILLTYNAWETELGYVQGMSDLCSPLYIVMDGDETLTFWSFVNLMEERMKPNFYRDQSGIKNQLSLLQQLMALMDPQLHKHLEETDSLNLFFCFRWILIAFKREFKFEDCLQVWEALWSAPCRQFHLFLAMSILEKHRSIIIRYLQEFDEVLKYINELSQTLEPQPLISQAEILYLGFRNLVESTDRRRAERQALGEAQGKHAATQDGLRQRSAVSKDKQKSANSDPLIKLVKDEVDAEANVPDLDIDANLRSLLDH